MQSDDILIRAKYLDNGLAIWPLNSDTASSIDSQLATLSPENARRCKRKFRKEWRKARRAMEDKELAESCFGSGKKPTLVQSRIRRGEVHKQFASSVKSENSK